jgi:uncharacterized protein
MSSDRDLCISRRVEPLIEEYLKDDPVVLLEGPRSVGKSTLLRDVAARHAGTVIDLDDLDIRAAATADPSIFIRDERLVLIDEYQKAPLVLDAIKAELNLNGRPGQYVLTGSTRFDALPQAAQSLTGRLVRLTVYPLSVLEILGKSPSPILNLFNEPSKFIQDHPQSQTTRQQYMDLITTGGFPLAMSRKTEASRNRWFDEYITLALERDARELRRLHETVDLALLLRRLAGQTGQLLVLEHVARVAELDRRTVQSYLKLLEDIFLVYRLPSWGKTLNSRIGATSKIHIMDSGIAANLLGLDSEKLHQKSPTALSQFGHLLESFVVGEIKKHASWMPEKITAWHWRTHDNHEVDLILERKDGSIIAFEIKSAGRVQVSDFSGLKKLQALAGDRFIAGFVLYLGSRSYRVADGLFVMPVDRLWS